MISLILPYWDRQKAANKALALIWYTYSKLDLEIVIVNDGGDFQMPTLPGLRIVRVDLPAKTEPMCPTLAWNAGVAASSGDLICLSCIEILHEKPVLAELAAEVERLGENGYVLASAWCPESDTWHCHTSITPPTCPKGTGIAFCGMMHRKLWDKIGGFDPEYRDGAGYEDRDFINQAHAAGAQFVIRDDLRVIHPKSGATIAWPPEKFERNSALYFEKWPVRTTVCCVNVGNYLGRGAEYVEKLRDMVYRNSTLPYTFKVFEDGDVQGLKGWDAKIALFHPDAFPAGERVVFFDLDTLIIGDVDNLLSYRGDFAVLRDFWRPHGYGPAVMLWKAGKADWIWKKYNRNGRPHLTRGDQELLEIVLKNPVILQDEFPDLFVSYKTHCHPYPPQGASVICFHGEPRPHECTQKWVQDAWKVGGASRMNLRLAVNTPVKRVLENVRANGDSAPWICRCEPHAGEAIIVGSGPSLLPMMAILREYARQGGVIFALNNAAKVLSDAGIKVTHQIVLDARADNVKFLGYAEVYLLASQCDPSLFAEVRGHILQWHPVIDGIADIFPRSPMTLIGGGTTVGLSAMALVYTMGYRKMHLFGYDSSFMDDQQHAIPQDRTTQENASFEVTVNDRVFRTNAAMARQAEIFPQFAQTLADMDVEIKVYGDGLLPHIAHCIARASAQQTQLLEA